MRLSNYHHRDACGTPENNPNFQETRCSNVPESNRIEQMNLDQLEGFSRLLLERQKKVRRCLERRLRFDQHCVYPPLRDAAHLAPIALMQQELRICENLRQRVNARHEAEFERLLREQEERQRREREELEVRRTPPLAGVFPGQSADVETEQRRRELAPVVFEPEPTDEEIALLPETEPDWSLDDEIRRARKELLKAIFGVSFFSDDVGLYRAYMKVAYAILVDRRGYEPSLADPEEDIIDVIAKIRNNDTLRALWELVRHRDPDILEAAIDLAEEEEESESESSGSGEIV
jgi:hypothetical protein